jgi:hypothetical protein
LAWSLDAAAVDEYATNMSFGGEWNPVGVYGKSPCLGDWVIEELIDL